MKTSLPSFSFTLILLTAAAILAGGIAGEIGIEENVGERAAQLVGNAIDEGDALFGEAESAPLRPENGRGEESHEYGERGGAREDGGERGFR